MRGSPRMNVRDIDNSNREAIERMAAAQPMLIDLKPAAQAIPGLAADELLHAGPPLRGWEEACNALRGAAAGTLLLAGAAASATEAAEVAETRWRLRSAAELCALATFGGVVTGETPVFIIEDATTGTRTYSAINEGRGAALRYGSTTAQTLERVRWLHGELAETLAAAVRQAAPIDLFAILEQSLQMGDDGHSRQKAASALFVAALAPALVETAPDPRTASRALRFLASNDFFYLPLAMAAAKAAMLAGHGVAGATIVTALAFNGVRCGIQVAGLDGWSTAPVPPIEGCYFNGYGEPDAGPVIGDSEIVEALGLGAFAMAGAPALARYVGGTVEQAAAFTAQMYAITVAEHPRFRIPALDGRGTPFGIDVRRVLRTGITPVFNTGIAHRDTGIGQIGAGHGQVPLACFQHAASKLGLRAS